MSKKNLDMMSMSRRSVVRGQAARVSPTAGEQIELGGDSALDCRRGETLDISGNRLEMDVLEEWVAFRSERTDDRQ